MARGPGGWPPCLDELADDGASWAEVIEAFLSTLPPSTARAYRTGIRAFFAYSGKPPAAVVAMDVLGWKRALTGADSTVKCRLGALSSLFRHLLRPRETDGLSYVTRNPVDGVKRPKVSMFDRAHPIQESDLKRILGALGDSRRDQRTRTWIIVHLMTGRRRAEIARMRWEDLEERGGVTGFRYRRKGGVADWCELPLPAVRALEAWRNGATTGSVWGCDENTLVRRFKRAASDAGLDPTQIRTHGIRHLAAKIMFERTKDVKAVQRWLRHESSSTTDIYLQAIREERITWADDVARRLLNE